LVEYAPLFILSVEHKWTSLSFKSALFRETFYMQFVLERDLLTLISMSSLGRRRTAFIFSSLRATYRIILVRKRQERIAQVETSHPVSPISISRIGLSYKLFTFFFQPKLGYTAFRFWNGWNRLCST